MRVNFVRHELLHESFRLVQREELGDADTDEGGFFLRVWWVVIVNVDVNVNVRAWMSAGEELEEW